MQARQLIFPELAVEQPAQSVRTSSFGDPAFAANKQLPLHRWVPWIAGFSSEFIRNILQRYLPLPGTVLDPFAGVGTTLVEAILCGHDAVGFEINPYAALACQIKLHAYELSVEKIQNQIDKFKIFYEEKTLSRYIPNHSEPIGFKTRAAFYSPTVLRKVLILQDFMDTITDKPVRDLFRLAFAATMIRYSNYSYEPSLGRRASAGKEDIHDFPVAQVIMEKLHDMCTDITWMQRELGQRKPDWHVINKTFFDYENNLGANSVDLIITSPPYLNNYHYNRNTRPQLYWLGYAERPQDLKSLEEANFGTYWQTVRELPKVKLAFDLPETDIAERLEHLGSLNSERGIYGGKGWANYAAAYFNDCYRFARGMHYVLKPGGTALIVIGNSILQGVMMPTDAYLGKIAEAVGLDLVSIEIPRATRVGNSIIQSNVRVAKAQDRHHLYEAVVELRRR